jgi:hypothetical protein
VTSPRRRPNLRTVWTKIHRKAWSLRQTHSTIHRRSFARILTVVYGKCLLTKRLEVQIPHNRGVPNPASTLCMDCVVVLYHSYLLRVITLSVARNSITWIRYLVGAPSIRAFIDLLLIHMLSWRSPRMVPSTVLPHALRSNCVCRANQGYTTTLLCLLLVRISLIELHCLRKFWAWIHANGLPSIRGGTTSLALVLPPPNLPRLSPSGLVTDSTPSQHDPYRLLSQVHFHGLTSLSVPLL